jgi:hypothetical protein
MMMPVRWVVQMETLGFAPVTWLEAQGQPELPTYWGCAQRVKTGLTDPGALQRWLDLTKRPGRSPSWRGPMTKGWDIPIFSEYG